jgi:hypothetical protein
MSHTGASDTDSNPRKPDAKTYYGYLFEVDKKPTKVLDALLRGVAVYIVCSPYFGAWIGSG